LSNNRPQVYLEGVYGNEDIDGNISASAFNADTDPDSRTYQGFESGNCVNNIRLEDVLPNLRGAFDIDCAYDECPLAGNEFFHISNVTLFGNFGFEGINNSTSYDGYSIYSSDSPVNLSVFGSYSLFADNISDEKSAWKAWIDYNQDGNFDDAELILDQPDRSSAFMQFTLPEDAVKGETIMRVTLTVPPECENNNNQYEEIEDYVIFICDDADQDGVCDVEDCDDSNPDIPSFAGESCDDGNPNTTDDFIQIDRCTCAGFYPCVPFRELSGTINSGIFFVQDYIHAEGQISAGSTVIFGAGNHIDLLPGFDAKGNTGTDFNAFTQDICPVNKQETDDKQIAIRNYPNPFTEQTTIEFELSKDTPVSLHSATFDGSNYPVGMYYYTIQAGEYIGTQKMVLIK